MAGGRRTEAGLPAAGDPPARRGPGHLRLRHPTRRWSRSPPHGRAANLPFERFGDRAEAAVGREPGHPGSRPAHHPGQLRRDRSPRPHPPDHHDARPVATRQPRRSPGASFFDDPDLVTVGDAGGFLEAGGMTPAERVAIEIVDDPAPESPSAFRARRASPTTRGSAPRSTRRRCGHRRWPAWSATSPGRPGATAPQTGPQPVGAGAVTAMAGPRVGNLRTRDLPGPTGDGRSHRRHRPPRAPGPGHVWPPGG